VPTLYQNYPNPFNPVTNISFDLPRQGYVSLVVYDIMGREIVRIIDGQLLGGGTINFVGAENTTPDEWLPLVFTFISLQPKIFNRQEKC